MVDNETDLLYLLCAQIQRRELFCFPLFYVRLVGLSLDNVIPSWCVIVKCEPAYAVTVFCYSIQIR